MRKRKQQRGEGEQESSRSTHSHSTGETGKQKARRSDRKTRSAGPKSVRGGSFDNGSDVIPDDIERQNFISVRRSARQAYHDGPAGETGVPESVRRVLSSAGQSLDTSVQRAMEDRMGDSLGGVQIHTGSRAAAACEEIDARAFTVGNHIAFNSGEYDPESAEGQHVLAHELAHVRQQTGGAVSMLPQDDVDLEIDPDPALEREAEETAQRVMEGGELGIQRLEDTEVHIQRMGEIDRKETYSPDEMAGQGGDGESLTEKLDEATTKHYRLTKEQLKEIVLTVDTAGELATFIQNHDIDVLSDLQDSLSSGLGGAGRGWRIGSTAGSVAGPVGAVAGGLAGIPLGYFLATKYGEDTAADIQELIRERLDLNTDQEFDTEGGQEDETSLKFW